MFITLLFFICVIQFGCTVPPQFDEEGHLLYGEHWEKQISAKNIHAIYLGRGDDVEHWQIIGSGPRFEQVHQAGGKKTKKLGKADRDEMNRKLSGTVDIKIVRNERYVAKDTKSAAGRKIGKKTINIIRSVSYHIIKVSDKSSTKISWKDIKVKTKQEQPLASCFYEDEYIQLVRFLKTLDDDVIYFVGITIKNQEFRSYHNIILNVDERMPLLNNLKRNIMEGVDYEIYWDYDRFFISEGDEFIGAQGIIESRDATLGTFKYFAWIINDLPEHFHYTLRDYFEVLGLKWVRGQKFQFLKADGSNLAPAKYITFDDDTIGTILTTVQKEGYSANLMEVTGSYRARRSPESVPITLLIRPVDEEKNIYYCGPPGEGIGDIAKNVYKQFEKIRTSRIIYNGQPDYWETSVKHSNNHEYVFNLFTFDIPTVEPLKCDDAKMRDHKGLVLINALERWSSADYSSASYVKSLHSRNLQLFFKPIKSSEWISDRFRSDSDIKGWVEGGHDLLSVAHMFRSDRDTELDIIHHTKEFHEDPAGMTKAELHSQYHDDEIKVKQFSDIDKKQHLLIYLSDHRGDPVMATDIESIMRVKGPKCVAVELDEVRAATGSTYQLYKHPMPEGVPLRAYNMDMYLVIRASIQFDFAEKLVCGDVLRGYYVPWMFLKNGLTDFSYADRGEGYKKRIYWDILRNSRNHLMTNIILKLFDTYSCDSVWFQMGKNHYEEPGDTTAAYPIQIKHLLTDKYEELRKPFRFTSGGDLIYRFDVYFDKAKEVHPHRAKLDQNDILRNVENQYSYYDRIVSGLDREIEEIQEIMNRDQILLNRLLNKHYYHNKNNRRFHYNPFD